MLEFIPKVAFRFHIMQKITFPMLLLENSQELYPLKVGNTLKAYVGANSELRKLDHLFIIPNRAWKGLGASSSVIAWLMKIISLAYRLKGLPVLEGVTRHSTCGVSTSWVAAGQVFLEKICKVAMWTSMHTFMTYVGRSVSASASSQN